MSVNNENMSTDSADRSVSGIQTDLMLTNKSNFTESKIMDEVEIHSTPISISQNKKTDDSGMLKDLYSIICSMKENSEKQHTVLNNKFDDKFNEQNKKFDALNNRMDNSDERFETKFN